MSSNQDHRFDALGSDPRYRLPSRKHARVERDDRFALGDGGDFVRKARVDRYGRKLAKGPRAGNTQKSTRIASDEHDELRDQQKAVKRRKVDVAPASDDEDDSDELDGDDEVRAELKKANGYDPARDGGFSSSSDESSSDEDEEDVEADVEALEDETQQEVAMGDVSSRLAIVNLDWDNVRCTDIMAVASSFIPSDGRIESVAIYPSEFGKERLEKEELEGPPREIFASAKRSSSARARDDSDEDDGTDEEDDEDTIRKKLQSGDTGEEFDSAVLRRYQLDRLRYFYAVITCSSSSAAQAIYTNMDGREYLTSANFFDLRFIPDETSFEGDKPREEVTRLPSGYKPNEFVTEALTHSKVKLTWDADDATRKEVQKRAFSRNDIDENDMRAYIGGDSSSEEDGDVPDGAENSKATKKEAERQKMRALLGLASEKREKALGDSKPVGEMQVTFTAGLSGREGRDGVFENSPPRDETTKERYVRKEKARKAKRKERMKAKRDGEEIGGEQDSEDDSGSEIGTAAPFAGPLTTATSEDPFDDPFFKDPEVVSKSKKEKIRKEDRLKRKEERQAQEAKDAESRKQLELLMDNDDGNIQHFDMKEIKKAAKIKSKDKKKRKHDAKRGDADANIQDVDNGVETNDPRFAGLFESHEYAIDPTNPRYQKTEGMKQLLEEGRKRRRDDTGISDRKSSSKKPTSTATQGDDTQKLLARVKSRIKT